MEWIGKAAADCSGVVRSTREGKSLDSSGMARQERSGLHCEGLGRSAQSRNAGEVQDRQALDGAGNDCSGKAGADYIAAVRHTSECNELQWLGRSAPEGK